MTQDESDKLWRGRKTACSCGYPRPWPGARCITAGCPHNRARGVRERFGGLMARFVVLLTLFSCACGDPTAPDDSAYYKRVCAAAEMRWIEGTRTCVGDDGTYINLQPPKR